MTAHCLVVVDYKADCRMAHMHWNRVEALLPLVHREGTCDFVAEIVLDSDQTDRPGVQ